MTAKTAYLYRFSASHPGKDSDAARTNRFDVYAASRMCAPGLYWRHGRLRPLRFAFGAATAEEAAKPLSQTSELFAELLLRGFFGLPQATFNRLMRGVLRLLGDLFAAGDFGSDTVNRESALSVTCRVAEILRFFVGIELIRHSPPPFQRCFPRE